MKLNAHGTVTFYPQDRVHSPKSISHLLTDTHQWPTQRSWLPKCRCVSKCLKHNYNLPFFHSKSLSLLFPKCSTYILKRKEKPEFCRSSVHRLGHAASSYWSWFTQATGALQYELFKLWWFWEVERVERYAISRIWNLWFGFFSLLGASEFWMGAVGEWLRESFWTTGVRGLAGWSRWQRPNLKLNSKFNASCSFWWLFFTSFRLPESGR